MELRVLKYFLAVAREENITRAAQLLHVTQPTLSRQLMQLEEELGVKLFNRTNHSIILTADGRLLMRHAQEIIELTEKTERDFARRDADISGEIALGGGEIRAVSVMADMLASFQGAHPAVKYTLYSGNADIIMERIENGSLDIGVLLEPVDIGRYDFIRLPVSDEWGLMVKADSQLAGKPCVTPRDLTGIRLIMPTRALVQSELADWFGAEYDKLNVVMTYNLLYNAAMMIRAGLGAALSIRLDAEYPGLTFVPLAPAITPGAVMVWKKDQSYSPAMQAFLIYTKKYMKSISNDTI